MMYMKIDLQKFINTAKTMNRNESTNCVDYFGSKPSSESASSSVHLLCVFDTLILLDNLKHSKVLLFILTSK